MISNHYYVHQYCQTHFDVIKEGKSNVKNVGFRNVRTISFFAAILQCSEASDISITFVSIA